jgi:tetraacyldisaccharide 4'-kinase
MLREAPAFWHHPRAGLAANLLRPVAALYGAITARKLSTAAPYRSRLPVVCVGNLTAGGTGKTPLALHLAARLLREGERPAFLTRGYGGRRAGPHRVDPGRDRARDVGDEALMLAQQAPTFVARDRIAGARAIEAGEASLIIMDDGLQNPKLLKDLRLAVIDAERGLGNGLAMPSGPLRAPLAAQLPLIDALVLSHGSADDDKTRRARDGVRASIETWWSGPIIDVSTRPEPGAVTIRGRRVVAFAGIGRPEKFFATVESLGGVLVERIGFPDHYAFKTRDAEHLLHLAGTYEAELLTTAKDWVRLEPGEGPLGRLKATAQVLPIGLDLAPDDAGRLAALVGLALRSGRAGGAPEEPEDPAAAQRTGPRRLVAR